jgi:hypothetical protein
MGSERVRRLLLGALVIGLGFVFYRMWAATSTGPSATSNGREGAASVAKGGDAPAVAAPDVHLRALSGERPKPGTAERNLFRFRPKPVPAPPPMPSHPAAPVAPLAPEVTGPPPPPPINLKFIGILERSGRPKIAILTDGIGPPIYGEEGKSVAGRYRILRIGAESIELSYLDGRGRQTIRLTGGS